MLYILCGTIISHGMQDKIVEVFDEIQRSNMSKLGENGEPIYREDGKTKGLIISNPTFPLFLSLTACLHWKGSSTSLYWIPMICDFSCSAM